MATAARIELIKAGIFCHQKKRDMLATALRQTRCLADRAQLIAQHAEACRCVTAFQAELAKD